MFVRASLSLYTSPPQSSDSRTDCLAEWEDSHSFSSADLQWITDQGLWPGGGRALLLPRESTLGLLRHVDAPHPPRELAMFGLSLGQQQ